MKKGFFIALLLAHPSKNMITFNSKTNVSAFINQQHTGFISENSLIKVCLVQYEIKAYHDSLFSDLAIHFPSELNSAVAKRCAEYLAGRYAAHFLLKQAGCDETVTIGSNREPVWPHGWVGSISHTSQWAIAVIAPQQSLISAGIDIESYRPEIMIEIASTFTKADEYRLLEQCGLRIETALLIAFSAKESLFKALYPQALHIFGFDAVKLCELDIHHRRFNLLLTKNLAPILPAGLIVKGQFLLNEKEVITFVTVD